MADSPNVLFIISDQHNAKVLGHEHHPDVETPNLDRMAMEGARCRRAITQNPICTPSRVSYLSGQYPHNHGYYGLSGPQPKGLPSIFGHLRSRGWRTGAIGKIHCPAWWVEDDCDLFHDTCGTSVEGRSPKYAAYLEERGLTDLEDHGAMQEFGDRGRQTVEGRPSMVSWEDGQEGWAVHEAIRFMTKAVDDGDRFFCHVSLPKPHQCYTPAQRFWDLYREAEITLPPNAEYDMEGKAPHLRRAAQGWRERDWQLFEPKTFEAGRLRKLHGYLGNISHVDHAVGELLDWLDGAGLARDTIVVYASDHGDYACEHGIMEKAPGICSDAITRVPMIWRWPEQFAGGTVVEDVVEAVDLPNTICSLAGVEAMETADGRDISAQLRGEPGDPERLGVTECPWSRSVRRGKWRLVYYPPAMFADEHPDGFGELYDVEADPWEMTNLYTERPDIARELERELLDWLVTNTRPATVHPPRQWTSRQAVTHYRNTVNDDGRINPHRLREMDRINYL